MCGGRSVTPRAVATACSTDPARTGTRSTKAPPAGKDSETAPATTAASRVLPIPPGPSRVTSRAPSETAAVTVATSCSRPTKVVPLAGTPVSPAAGRAVSARSASARRSATPYLRSSDETWLSTVRTEMCRARAIWALDRCAPSAISTSASRAEISAATRT